MSITNTKTWRLLNVIGQNDLLESHIKSYMNKTKKFEKSIKSNYLKKKQMR